MNFLFASSHSLAIPIAKSLLKVPGFSGFLTKPDALSGRDRSLRENSFSFGVIDLGRPIFKADSASEISKLLIRNEIDLVITCAYGKLISEELLNIPTHGWLNIHYSSLPKWRGAAPVQRAIMAGESEIGYSIFKMDKGLDTGAVLFREVFNFSNEESCSRVLEKLSNLAATKIVELLKEINNWKFQIQDEEGATLDPKILKEERRLNIHESAMSLVNKVRALDINGGAFLIFRGENLNIQEAIINDESENDSNSQSLGEIFNSNGKILIKVGTGLIEVLRLQSPGKKSLLAKDWLNGANLLPGEKVE